MKASITKLRRKTKTVKDIQKLITKKRRGITNVPLEKDPFFSSAAVDIGRTNNDIIDQILYGKNGN